MKCPEHNEIFEIVGSMKHWVENWDTFTFLAKEQGLTWNELLAKVEVIPFEKLRDNYKVGPTRIRQTGIVEGKKPKDIFYPEVLPAIPRKMSILGTCLPGCEEMWKDLGGTHFYGNRLGWPDYGECERLGLKVFVNIHPDDHGFPSEDFIKETVNEYKDRPVCGGYWSDSAGGHEPDITNRPPSEIQRYLDQRERFYDTVRKYDPDIEEHPIMEMFNCTEYDDFPDHPYPGWKLAYSRKTHNLLIVDIYSFSENDDIMKEEITSLFRKLIKLYAHTHQVVPQINAVQHRNGSIWCAYNTWVELLNSEEFDNPYRSPKVSLAYYKDEMVRKNEDMQREIKEVNEKIKK